MVWLECSFCWPIRIISLIAVVLTFRSLSRFSAKAKSTIEELGGKVEIIEKKKAKAE